MADIATWGDHTFTVSSTKLYGFEDLKIKAASKTKTKTKKSTTYGKQTITYRDVADSSEVSMKTKLFANLGVDPKTEAKSWLSDAHIGKSDRLKINGTDLLECDLILITAEVSEVSILPNGDWTSCEVSLTFKQRTIWDNQGTAATTKKSSSSSSSKKKSSSSSSSTKIYTAGGVVSGSDSGKSSSVKVSIAGSVKANKTSTTVKKLTTTKKTSVSKVSSLLSKKK